MVGLICFVFPTTNVTTVGLTVSDVANTTAFGSVTTTVNSFSFSPSLITKVVVPPVIPVIFKSSSIVAIPSVPNVVEIIA